MLECLSKCDSFRLLIWFPSFCPNCSACTTSPSSSTWAAPSKTPWWTWHWRTPATRPCTRWPKDCPHIVLKESVCGNGCYHTCIPVLCSWVWTWRSWRTWRKMLVWEMVVWAALLVSSFSHFISDNFKEFSPLLTAINNALFYIRASQSLFHVLCLGSSLLPGLHGFTGSGCIWLRYSLWIWYLQSENCQRLAG